MAHNHHSPVPNLERERREREQQIEAVARAQIGRYSRRSPSFSPSPQPQLAPSVYMQLRVQAGGQVTYEPLYPDGSTTGPSVTTAPPLPGTGPAPTVVEEQGRKVYSRALRFAPETLSDEACLREVFTLPAAMALNLASLPNPPPGQPPHFPLPLLCALAIYGSPIRRLTVSEIYQALEDRFQYYRDSKSWQNSVRHLLSLNKIFRLEPRPKDEPGKGNYWTLDFSHGTGNKRERKRGGGSARAPAAP